MKYVEYLNAVLREECARTDNLFLFGQNIDTGSCLGGLTRGLQPKTGRVINTPNVENSLVGMGFGLMLSGAKAIYFVKQLDFLMLAMDQLVNTYSMIRTMGDRVKGSFMIFTVIVDNEGPQASFTDFQGFCDLAKVPRWLMYPGRRLPPIDGGFKIVGVHQQTLAEEFSPHSNDFPYPLLGAYPHAHERPASVVEETPPRKG